MSDVSIELIGSQQLIRMLATTGGSVVPALGRALSDEAEQIFAKSQDRVPFDRGTLSISGHVFPPSIHGNDVLVEIGYGGNASAYAEIQHERTDFRHDPGRTSHYLETPFDEAMPGFDSRIGRRIEAILRGLI